MNFLAAEVVRHDAGEATVAIGKSEITIKTKRDDPGLAPGDAVVVGIRPEHIAWQPRGGAGIPARVELVEQLEPDSFIAVSPKESSVRIRTADDYAKDGGNDPAELVRADDRLLVIRVDAAQVPPRETELEIVIDASRAHLFHSTTEKAL
jgi:ABC-type sugar transport system ATPase subunit